ncbi:hypothetical protein G7Z17_g843 [Cylindrodendrum hubeiense]|uniref:Transglycosylase SLT domain-containing protein n=1 Tax=Cylindrodendrum hubeiense TaxID=595255 RepID=A0A9P5LD10_9HYPO|nr:hypothetical protein G7Z17_g843 [Cylindrodendrum hubeiense]
MPYSGEDIEIGKHPGFYKATRVSASLETKLHPIERKMPTLNRYLAVASAVAFNLVAAETNPDAQGACDATQGGDGACGPNGSESWLNTGLDADGWNPPFLDINNLTHISLEDYYNGAGQACQQYDAFFQSSGEKYSIDPAILAFIAMQESSCNADEGGYTPGLMQCDPSNCQNGQSSCQYPIQDNVDCGANVLKNALDNANGNAIRALGSYNGWFTAEDYTGLNGGKGITEDYPCSGEGQQNGSPQNLDYLHEVLNGWFQGYDIYGNDANLGGSYECEGTCNGENLC